MKLSVPVGDESGPPERSGQDSWENRSSSDFVKTRPLLWSKRTSGERVTGRATEERVSERENDGEEEEKKKKRELGRGRGSARDERKKRGGREKRKNSKKRGGS
jgi:hypothetical protein